MQDKKSGLVLRPSTLEAANALIEHWHRHHKPAQGQRFSIMAYINDTPCGAAIMGRPVARLTDQNEVLEVTRLVTNGQKNACSFLYGACARIARDMGFARIQTAILDSETGLSLLASGWKLSHLSGGGSWTRQNRRRREDQPQVSKQIWVKDFRPIDPLEVPKAANKDLRSRGYAPLLED